MPFPYAKSEIVCMIGECQDKDRTPEAENCSSDTKHLWDGAREVQGSSLGRSQAEAFSFLKHSTIGRSTSVKYKAIDKRDIRNIRNFI